MSMTTAPARGRLPRWAWALIVLLVVVTALAVAVATFAVRGKAVLDPPAASLPSPTRSEGAGSPSTPSPGAAAASGCLGGATDLDAAVIAAQQQAARTPEGAAAFTAALVRWSGQLPPSNSQRSIAQRLLANGATKEAVRALSSAERTWPAGKTASFDFAHGRYYIEDFDATEAAVTFLAEVHGVEAGQRLPDARVAGTLHLRFLGGSWHLFDVTYTRSLDDAARLGSVYQGGC